MSDKPSYEELMQRVIALEQVEYERKQAESKLARIEKKSRVWLEHSPICTKIIDLNLNLQYMSRAGIEGLGIEDITKLYGHPYPFDFYPDSFKKSMTANLLKAKETSEIVTQEAAVVDTNGNELWFHSTIVPVDDDDDGRINYLMVVSADTTECKRAEAVLRKADDLKDNFMSTITHELLTPINGVRLSLSLLEKNIDVSSKEYLAMANSSNNHMLHLVESMITFTEARRGSLTIHRTPLSINSILKGIFDHFERDSESKITFNYHFDTHTPEWILSDEYKLRVVIVQLMKNAVTFTDQGEVTLRCSSVTKKPGVSCLVISVQDTGIGMNNNVQQGIFSAFSQADASITREHGGLGIGLTNVKDILHLMDAELDVVSEIDSGSTFTITLPITLATEQQINEVKMLSAKQNKTASSEALTQYKNAKILVVEDNPVNMALVLSVLKRSSYRALPAKHGKEALDVIQENPDVAAVLMDCQMPVMDGFEATQRIRKMRGFEGLPIIAVTANIGEQDQQRCLAAGMSDYLAKPASLKSINMKLAKWLGGDTLKERHFTETYTLSL